MKQLLLGIIISIMAIITAVDINAQQTQGQPPQAQLPSEQTAQSLAQLPSEIERPDLRARPTDTDGSEKPQKVTTGQISQNQLSLIFVILLAYGIKRYYKNYKQKLV